MHSILLANGIAAILLIRVLLIHKDFGDEYDAREICFRVSKIYIAFINNTRIIINPERSPRSMEAFLETTGEKVYEIPR